MSGAAAPAWFDRSGMSAWAGGMARALRRQVRIVGLDGRELVVAGNREGPPLRLPLEVNGAVSGFVEVIPGELSPAVTGLVTFATETLRSMAEVRFSMADLVRTTARQWRELSVLYRSSELMRGWQEPIEIAQSLAVKARRALRARAAVVRFSVRGAPPESAVEGDDAGALHDVAAWGSELAEPCLASTAAELQRLGFSGSAPDGATLVVAMRVRDRTHGVLVLAAGDHGFGSEDLKLATLLAGQAALGFANLELIEEVREAERFRAELETAASIQESILPPEELDLGWLEIAATCRPAAWVGGDAFFTIPQPDGGVLAGVADVSGHGLSSALLMNGFATAVRALAREVADPGHVAAAANDLVTERVGDMGMFVTAAFASLAPGGRVAVANAGHPPVALVSPGGAVSLLEATGVPLGVLPGETFPLTETELEVGGFLVVYSDGVTETRSAGGAMFEVEGLREAAARLAAAGSTAGELRDRLLEELERYRGEGPLTDDLTLLVIGRKT